MLDEKNFAYLTTRKYKLRKFNKNNNKLSKEELKFRAGKHIEPIIHKIRNINNKKKQQQEKIKYQAANDTYNETLRKQQHIDAVINKINSINSRREQQEENMLKEKLNNLINGVTNTNLDDKNKDISPAFNDPFSSTASATDEQSEKDDIYVPYVDKYMSNNYTIFNHFDSKKRNSNINVPIWRQSHRQKLSDKHTKMELFTKPIRNDKPVKLFLSSGFTHDIATKNKENDKSSFLKAMLRDSDRANKNSQMTQNQEIKKTKNKEPIKLALYSGRAAHRSNFK